MRLSMRLTLAMTTLVVSAVAAVGVLAYYNVGRAVVPAGLVRLAGQAKARLGAIDTLLSVVQSQLNSSRRPARPSRTGPGRLNGGIDPQERTFPKRNGCVIWPKSMSEK